MERHDLVDRRFLVGVAALACALTTGAPAGSAPAPRATATRDELTGVFCTSSANCLAVGSTTPAKSGPRTLTERWNGRTWSKVASPNAAGQVTSVLTHVGCASATNCFALGYSATTLSGKGTRALMERWNGTVWSIVPVPSGVTLGGVACPSATSCFAVGNAIEHWNGTTWSIMPAPKPVSLAAVSCVSTTSCVAIGGGSQRWNGKTWSVVPTPQPTDPGFEFFSWGSISCTTATSCFAVGEDAIPVDDFDSLAAVWNGKTWTRLGHSAYVNSPGAFFDAVTCTSPTSCLVVSSSDPALRPVAAAYRWDGATFSTVATPSFGKGSSALDAISCSSAADCFAVGSLSRPLVGDLHALIEHWNGTTWSTVVPAPAAAAHLPAS